MARKPRDPAWMPADYTASVIDAVKALAAGTADASQQTAALDWMIKVAADTYGEPFFSNADGGERDTSFALGRAFVGRQIVKLINMPPSMVAKLREKDG